jgi:hypothetical protein
MPPKRISLDEIMKIFELSWNDVPDIRVPERSYEEMNKKLVQFRLRFKKAYRKIVFKHHPDHGGDPEKMKMINELYDIIMNKIKIQVPQPRPSVIVRFYGDMNRWDSTASTTTSTTWW